MKHANQLYFNTGVTFIEILVVIFIFSTLATLAIPYYRGYIADNQAVELVNEITTSIHLAKNESLHTDSNITLCALAATGSSSCNTSASTWTYGWQVINLSTGQVLHTYQPSSASGIMVNPASSITFLPSGFPSPQTVTFTIKPSGCNTGYIINYSTTTPGALLQTQTTTCP